MEKKTALKKKSVIVPRDRTELEQFVSVMSQAQGKIDAIFAGANVKISEHADQIKKIMKKAQEMAKPFEVEINERAKGVFIYAESHRAELTDEDKKKTVDFATGDKIRWYFPPASIIAEDAEAAIAELERRGLKEYIRTIKEINREKILENPEIVKGLKCISIGQEEILAIILAAIGLELQKGDRKFKKIKAD